MPRSGPGYHAKPRDKREIKDLEWYEQYFALEAEIEKINEENEKMRREIGRRTDRYVKNEKEYRQQINQLERELRVRKGLEPNARDTNLAEIDRIEQAIHDNIDNYEN